MGFKIAVPQKRMIECKYCFRQFMSRGGLLHHMKINHKSYKEINLDKSKLKVKLVKRNDVPPEVRKAALDHKIQESSRNSGSDIKLRMCKRLGFECPVCRKVFTSFFSANRHMKKWHATYLENNELTPMKPIEVEICSKCGTKMASGVHHKCGIEVKQETENPYISLNYGNTVNVCAACKLEFSNQMSFEGHVKGVHCIGVETLFFPTHEVFKGWKKLTEEQTEIKFELVKKDTHLQTKQLYCCSAALEINKNRTDNKLHLCPALMFVQNFPKGIQVHFYKAHYGHTASKYKLMNAYKKYSITSLMKKAEAYSEIMNITTSDQDLYTQFKTLMESIIMSAAKINLPSLKELIGKALEMTSILTEYNEDDDTLEPTALTSQPPEANSGLETEINKAIETTRVSERIKIKKSDSNEKESNVGDPPSSDDKIEMKTPKIVNTFSLDNNTDLDKKLTAKSQDTNKNVGKPVEAAKKPISNRAVLSFVDTYKNFVDSNCNNANPLPKKTRNAPKTTPTNKNVPKTGEKAIKNNDLVAAKSFQNSTVNKTDNPTQSNGTSDVFPVKPSTFYNASSKTEKTNDTDNDDTEDEKPDELNASLESVDLEDFDNVKFKLNPDYNKNSRRQIQKQKFKTKIGQFNPISPKKADSSLDSEHSPIMSTKRLFMTKDNESPPKRVKFSKNVTNMTFKTAKVPGKQKYGGTINTSKIRVDEYEVKEQENDCNILILKI